LEATMARDAILQTIVETIAQALKLPYVAIDLWHEDQIVAAVAHGTPGNGTTSLPLVYQSEPVGYLRLSPRAPGEPFSQADQHLLAGIAHQAGVAAYAVQLTADLQRSRERLVTLREEERRRIRRDLHDVLGPALGSMSLKLEA